MIRIYIVMLLGWFTASASSLYGASTVTPIVANGILMGAQHVQVGGNLYTVLFVDGSCMTLFSGCDPQHFTFRDSASAQAASLAMRDQVWTGIYAQNPSLIHGCELGPMVCNAWTPYQVRPAAFPEAAVMLYVTLSNEPPLFHLYYGSSGAPLDWDTGTSAGADHGVFAVWTSETSPSVPMDFNGDGTTDILMRSATGNVSILLMDGAGGIANTSLGNVSADWNIAGSGDFNGDGKADILWRDSSGNVAIWIMDGGTILQNATLQNVANRWTIVAVRDFNGDGKADILWQDAGGVLALWLMNGTQYQPAYLGTLPGMKVQ